MTAVVELQRSQVLASRAYGHGLVARQPLAALTVAAGAAGIRLTRNTALSFAARVHGATADAVDRALERKQLVAISGPRGNTTIVPAEDAFVFAAGVVPRDEASIRAILPGTFLTELDNARISATDALTTVAAVIRAELAAGPLPRSELAGAVTRAVPVPLAPPCPGRCPDPHVENSLFWLARAADGVCFQGATDVLDLPERWLPGADTMQADRELLRLELTRRYLRCYGPSKPAALAEWAGIPVADARTRLALLNGEIVETVVDRAKAGVMLAADERAGTLEPPAGVRFLPPYDAYLLDRDRATLLPDRAARRAVWRSLGNPGVVLVDGVPAATWRTRRRSDGIDVAVAPLLASFAAGPETLHAEAQYIAAAFGIAKPVTPVLANGNGR